MGADGCGHLREGFGFKQPLSHCFPGKEPPPGMAQSILVFEPFDEPARLVNEALLGSLGRQRANDRFEHSLANRTRKAVPARFPSLGKISFVTSEKFIAAVSGQCHCDAFACVLGNLVGGKDREVADRIVHVGHQPIEQPGDLDGQNVGRVFHAKVTGDALRPRQLVVGFVVEADAERVSTGAHPRHYERTIHAARKKAAERNVADQLALDRFPNGGIHLFLPFFV